MSHGHDVTPIDQIMEIVLSEGENEQSHNKVVDPLSPQRLSLFRAEIRDLLFETDIATEQLDYIVDEIEKTHIDYID